MTTKSAIRMNRGSDQTNWSLWTGHLWSPVGDGMDVTAAKIYASAAEAIADTNGRIAAEIAVDLPIRINPKTSGLHPGGFFDPTLKESQEKELTVRAKAFSGRGIETVRVLVSGDEVRVWDCVAGHYTLCHSLSPAAIRRIVRLATTR